MTPLAETIRNGILRTSPHGGLTGPGPFDGSYDWHSCVHAHWALLVLARLDDDADLDAWVMARLDDETLAREQDFLDAHPSFEQPYGRAWYLLLLSERARRRPSPLKQARDELLAYLDGAPFPEDESAICATHQSWLFAALLGALADGDNRARWIDRIDARVDELRGQIHACVYDDYDFLDLHSLVQVVDLLAERSVEPRAITLVGTPELGHGHACARPACQLWPTGMLAKLGDAHAVTTFDAGMAAILERPAMWRDDFVVSHWVPQFLTMALWMRTGLV